MVFKDYYKILGFDTNKVTVPEIKVAFREQAKKYHPDVNQENDTAEERFKDINEAYKILTGNNTRRKYDRMWNLYVGKKKRKIEYEKNRTNTTSTFGEIFNIFFGTTSSKETIKENKKLPIKGENVETEVNVKLEDAYFGLEKKISLRTVKRKNENIHNKNTFWNKKRRKNSINWTRQEWYKWRKKRRFIYKN